jgi:hypothetical protein
MTVPLQRFLFLGALASVTGCGAAPPHPATQPVTITGDSSAPGVTDTDVPDAARETYDNEKLYIVDVKADRTYGIRDGQGYVVTENEFVRRYRQLVGNELNGYERNHALGTRIALSTAVALGLVVMVGGLVVAVSNSGQCSGTTITGAPNCGIGTAGVIGAIVGGVGFGGAVVGAVPLFSAFGRASYDGPPTNHLLNKDEALLYIARYNRALVAKAVHDAASPDTSSLPVSPPPGFTLSPVVSPGFTGIVAQF